MDKCEFCGQEYQPVVIISNNDQVNAYICGCSDVEFEDNFPGALEIHLEAEVE